MKALKRDESKPIATKQFLAKRNHHDLPILVHQSSAKAFSLGTRNSDYEAPALKLKGTRVQERLDKSGRL